MATVVLDHLFHHHRMESPKLIVNSRKACLSSVNYIQRPVSNGATFCSLRSSRALTIRACSSTTLVETPEYADVLFNETIPLTRTERVEGKILVRLDSMDADNWQLIVGCNLPGKWVLHWGVNYIDDIGSEWDQPPIEMRPPDSIAIKDYAIETPLKKLSKASEDDPVYEVKINFDRSSSLAAINFVLKDEVTGAWYQHRGRDFQVPLLESSDVGSKREFALWPGTLGHLSNTLLKSEGTRLSDERRGSDLKEPTQQKMHLEAFSEEHSIVKETPVVSSLSVSVKKCSESPGNVLYLETDLPGNVVVHWGVCRDESKKWEIPAEPYPAGTAVFKKKALQTQLQQKEGGNGSSGVFFLDEEFSGFLFVLKLNDGTWLNCIGNDFYVPIPNVGWFISKSTQAQPEVVRDSSEMESDSSLPFVEHVEDSQTVSAYADEIISEIRNLVTAISSKKSRETKSIEVQESILQEIEKLAVEAYTIFRRPVSTFMENAMLEKAEELKPPMKLCSGTGSGFEILCQGFNWESHKSGRWYWELHEKALELSSLGFTVVWLPPPTESISPEGYMPRDLYNLNSSHILPSKLANITEISKFCHEGSFLLLIIIRYGSIDELKVLVKRFHEVNIRVLGDAVLNHRCAHYKNQNGVWNIFGGRLNWDDRAVVADDPHFEGRGNKSSGDNFHAAPNIDHSQEFVRKDLQEWLCWLRKEIGYDGWRLDFVRGFWGGYVKDYMEASEPYFAVGEYWDSLSYTYGEMDRNQDAHRQRIIDWINATNGTAGAFDVTTKGILHSAIGRCEYWRLSDEKAKPPGVVGWWPSRAVTFIENHDTGSTQGHWRFPGGKEMQGYAYILTHPGTPSVFYDHIFSSYRTEIASLISLRGRNKIHCRSTVQITKAERDVYAAMIDEKVSVKIGPGQYEPPSGSQRWSLALEGQDYKVWEAS